MSLEFPAKQVAALFIEWGGVYFHRNDVVTAGYATGNDQDQTTRIIKDARHYDGPHPIVAHPPCNSWGSFATTLNYTKHDKRVGADDGCFESALKSVRKWGGVIEHPANSMAWQIFNLAKPRAYHATKRDLTGGFSIFVNQSHYGHLAQKPTWLYICGYRGDFKEDFYIPQGKKRVKYGIGTSNNPPLPTHLKKRTPKLFAELLISIAKRCTFYRKEST